MGVRRVLTMIRVPGSKVPTLRCQGDLTLDTSEALRREIALATLAGAPGVVLNIDRLNGLDRDGASTLSQIAGLSAAQGQRLMLVAGTESARGLLAVSPVDSGIGVFESEDCAETRLLS